MSKLDDKDLSKIAAGGSMSEIAPGSSGDSTVDPGKKPEGPVGGGGVPPEDQPTPDGATQDLE